METAHMELAAIMARAEALGVPVAAVDFMGAILNGPDAMQPSALGQAVEFAATQRAKWLVRYQFSPAGRPDEAASKEADNWDTAWNSMAEALFKAVPEVRDELTHHRSLSALTEAISASVALTEGRPVARALNSIRSRAGIYASRVGFKRIGSVLYASARYPPGSVGRAGV